jgi:hypothetical protein
MRHSPLRWSAVMVLTAVGLLASAPAASALTKVRSDAPLATEPVLMKGFCPFPVTWQDLSGNQTQTLTFDDEGNLLEIDVRGTLTSQLSANGKTFTFFTAGALTVVPQPDGTDLVTLNGRSWNADQGSITDELFMATAVGHVIIRSAFNPDTGVNDFSTSRRTALRATSVRRSRHDDWRLLNHRRARNCGILA